MKLSQSQSPEASIDEGAGAGAFGRGMRSALTVGLIVGLVDGIAANLRLLEVIPLAGQLGGTAASILVYTGFFGLLLVPFELLLALLGRRAGRGSLLLGLTVGLFFEVYWSTREYIFPGYSATSPERLASTVGLFLLSLALVIGFSRLFGSRARRLSKLALPLWVVAALGGSVFLWQEHSLLSSHSEGDLDESNRDLPNVLFIIVDALRADVIGAYGNEHVATPVMDRLAHQGVLFENARAQAPFTWSSFGSFLTGKYPRRHGMLKLQAGMQWAIGINTTMPLHFKTAKRVSGEELDTDDFVTAAFMTGAVTKGSGLLLGIDLYCEALKGHELVHRSSSWSLLSTDLVFFNVWNKLTQRLDYNKAGTTAEKWLAENAEGKRFFAFLHLYSTHTPYDPEPEFRERYVDPDYDGPIQAFYAEHRYAIEAGQYEPTEADKQQIRNLYYAGVTQADHAIGSVLDELERAGVLENTIVVVTSDHGEELGEHGVWEHNWMYQTNLEIPLIIRWPGQLPGGVRVRPLVDSVDLMPTLCDLMGLELPTLPTEGDEIEYHRVDGMSLLPLVRGEREWQREFSFAESGPALSIQDLRWKLVISRECLDYAPDDEGWARPIREPLLFDLEADPEELNNLFDPRHAEVARLLPALREWNSSLPIAKEAVMSSHRDREAEELLGNLGYADGIGGDDELDESLNEDE